MKKNKEAAVFVMELYTTVRCEGDPLFSSPANKR